MQYYDSATMAVHPDIQFDG